MAVERVKDFFTLLAGSAPSPSSQASKSTRQLALEKYSDTAWVDVTKTA